MFNLIGSNFAKIVCCRPTHAACQLETPTEGTVEWRHPRLLRWLQEDHHWL